MLQYLAMLKCVLMPSKARQDGTEVEVCAGRVVRLAALGFQLQRL